MSTASPDKPYEVLIVEDQRAAARVLKRKLTDLGCNCTPIVREHLLQFMQWFQKEYPHRFNPASVRTYDGTVLDVIYHEHEGEKQNHGGAHLYTYWEQRGILPHLGLVLVATESRDAIDLFGNKDVRITPKLNSEILGKNLGAFVSNMAYKRARELATRLQLLTGITVTAKATQDGHLYGNIAAAEISKALRSLGHAIDAEMVVLEEPIKQTGSYEIKLRLGHGVETTLKASIISPEK